MEHKAHKQEQRRCHAVLKALKKETANSKCADCSERNPMWASIIQPPIKGGKEVGIFCCHNCQTHHRKLGEGVCEVKSLSKATKCK